MMLIMFLKDSPSVSYEDQRNREGLDEEPTSTSSPGSQELQLQFLLNRPHYRVWISECAQDHHSMGYLGQVLSLPIIFLV